MRSGSYREGGDATTLERVDWAIFVERTDVKTQT
jgi:hypothetical protein